MIDVAFISLAFAAILALIAMNLSEGRKGASVSKPLPLPHNVSVKPLSLPAVRKTFRL